MNEDDRLESRQQSNDDSNSNTCKQGLSKRLVREERVVRQLLVWSDACCLDQQLGFFSPQHCPVLNGAPVTLHTGAFNVAQLVHGFILALLKCWFLVVCCPYYACIHFLYQTDNKLSAMCALWIFGTCEDLFPWPFCVCH